MRFPDKYLSSVAAGRREFLKKSLAGTLLLGSAGFLAQCVRRAIVRPTGLLVLDAAEFKTLLALSQAVLPGPETTAAVLGTPYRIDLEVSQWSSKNRSQVKSLLALVENGTRYFLFSWRSFSELSIGERQAYLRSWEHSRLDFRREAYQVLRMLAFFFYYSQDATWKAIGYDGPWVKSGS